MTALLIVNPRAGAVDTEELLRLAARRGIETRVLGPGEEPGAVARASAADVLAVAGGDGSLAPVAAAALERDVPFACVPLGTRNHFARDLGLDEDVAAALDGVAGGEERQVDVGRANGIPFLNTVSLGLYAHLVHRRERHRRRSEALARVRALAIVARHRAPLGLAVDGEAVRARILLVSCGAYRLEPWSIGERERLDEGRLHLYVPGGLLRGGWAERDGETFTVDARGRRLRAAVDGEPAVLETPIHFTVEPSALRVRVPRGPVA